MCLLGESPRLDVLRILAAEPLSEGQLAERLGLAGYELLPHLQALHEQGVVAQDDHGNWQITPRAIITQGERQVRIGFSLADGWMVTWGLNRHPESDTEG